MTRSCAFLALTFAVLALASLVAFAQSGEGDAAGSRRAAGDLAAGAGLLGVPEVQKDLELTDTQKVQILALRMEARDDPTNLGKKLEGVLKPEQIQRLSQIRLQVEGPAALLSPEVALALDLTQEQRQNLKALQDQVRDTIRRLVQETKDLTPDEKRAKMPELIEKMQKNRKETIEKAVELLTPQQREKFEKMQGPKVNFGSATRLPPKPVAKPPVADGDAK